MRIERMYSFSCYVCNERCSMWLEEEPIGLKKGICKACYRQAKEDHNPELSDFEEYLSAKKVIGKLEGNDVDTEASISVRVVKNRQKRDFELNW